VAITGVANLAVKVADLEGAVAVPLGPLQPGGGLGALLRDAPHLFVDAPGEMRLEFMDQLEEPS